MNFLQQLFCKHHFRWVRNIHGDEINFCGGKRSVWICLTGHKVQLRENRYSVEEQPIVPLRLLD